MQTRFVFFGSPNLSKQDVLNKTHLGWLSFVIIYLNITLKKHILENECIVNNRHRFSCNFFILNFRFNYFAQINLCYPKKSTFYC